MTVKHLWVLNCIENSGTEQERDIHCCSRCHAWGSLDFQKLVRGGVFPEKLSQAEYDKIISQHMEIMHPGILPCCEE